MHKLVAAVGLSRAPIICMAVYIAALLPGHYDRGNAYSIKKDYARAIGRITARRSK